MEGGEEKTGGWIADVKDGKVYLTKKTERKRGGMFTTSRD